jgi:diketogulonate reductase-like aldo/keto reductase
MEVTHDSGQARMLGVSNFQIKQLQQLWQEASVRPRFVQNRCYASLGWDRQVREFCRTHDVVYQGFSLLTANRQILTADQLVQIAARHRRTIPQIVFRFAIQIGMIPLTGTSDAEHMQADLEVFDFRLEPAEVAWIQGSGNQPPPYIRI